MVRWQHIKLFFSERPSDSQITRLDPRPPWVENTSAAWSAGFPNLEGVASHAGHTPRTRHPKDTLGSRKTEGIETVKHGKTSARWPHASYLYVIMIHHLYLPVFGDAPNKKSQERDTRDSIQSPQEGASSVGIGSPSPSYFAIFCRHVHIPCKAFGSHPGLCLVQELLL